MISNLNLKTLMTQLFSFNRKRLLSVPVMDGPLKPNDLLEDGEKICFVEEADNLTAYKNSFLISSNKSLLKIRKNGKIEIFSNQESRITALAVSKSGDIALGIENKGVKILDQKGNSKYIEGTQNLNCITSLCFLSDGTLMVVNGSEDFSYEKWVHDLVNFGASGSLLCISTDHKNVDTVVSGLAFPSGVCEIRGANKKLALTETWTSKLLEVDLLEKKICGDLISELPSYPARIDQLSNDYYLLTNYSTRSQLIEFVLGEKRYLKRMISEIPSQYWVAPSLSSKNSFKEPLQAGGVIRLGIHKPWSPTCSYGLIIILDSKFKPIASAHSRANGSRHGVLSAAELDNDIFMASKGNGECAKVNGFFKNLDEEK